MLLPPAEHRVPGGDKKDSPAEHPTAPSRLHNFNFKSWGGQRHLRRCTNLHARKPPPDSDPVSLPQWNLRARSADQEEEKRGEVTAEAATSPLEEKIAERRVFCVTLLREEIEEDIYAMKGTRPARRPRKRTRGLQRQLDMLFPGCYLNEVTLDTYKVVE
ncbi:hypothetical protein LUZ63_014865 [Rhynchospora breviuscula]|uniref:Uncharacterized protein n=1 Tax=Rhynchospora breviuscula TaxID=2022672 RepID=A0A9Q0CBL4_9POAL|nr:hypothetical protein LUZ63_014865 [Rhynchospora breviuscula]